MYTLIAVIHIIVCLILMAVVLLQAGKGAEMGAAFGGSSQTIFGSRGAATFLSKLTVGAAILFMVTSLSLSILSRERSIASSIIDTETKDELIPKELPAAGGPNTLPADPSADSPANSPEGAPAAPAPAK
ncbi:preprotein translocase subunit SecG [Candidatus Manganitrophus noduliformans]|uniref:Protein-export membrane protein SecG n=1 Tax=Candidatus Manganitrophus noduliformans TaxID=2606439 RepID=A0A7X6I9J1_9BACT|nr:preprotein translocase subunit SecG [Candidatus Manganitrophus noduliformans]NKE69430.1 preprotein translocase subunit SecG [Candidatus Manganitrophus noduliformans]